MLNELAVLSSVQVNLRVRVAEISRDITRELGFNWQALGSDRQLRARPASGAAAATRRRAPSRTASGQPPPRRRASAPRATGSRFDINAIIDALAQDQLITILAEPNLTAQSGETASFLAGGEFPIPVAGDAHRHSITIEFKQFGVSLAFVPTVLGPDRLNLRVRPEVSELSDNGAINLPIGRRHAPHPGAQRCAARRRRSSSAAARASPSPACCSGHTARSATASPACGDIPVLGALFRSDRFRRNETELVIIVTPYLVRPVSDPRAARAPDRRLPARHRPRSRPVQPARSPAAAPPAAGPGAAPDAGFILE